MNRTGALSAHYIISHIKMFGRLTAMKAPVRCMATAATDPIQKLFLDNLAKASKDVYKAGAVSPGRTLTSPESYEP